MGEFTNEQIQNVMDDMDIDKVEDMEDDRMLAGEEWREGYGPPEPEEKQNAHTFLHKAVFNEPKTLKTTWLSESELGRPDFSVRFLLSIKTVAEDLINPICIELNENNEDPELDKMKNGIAEYFSEKTENITASGLSNKGFSMNINVTRKMDAKRERVKNLEPVKGGTPRI